MCLLCNDLQDEECYLIGSEEDKPSEKGNSGSWQFSTFMLYFGWFSLKRLWYFLSSLISKLLLLHCVIKETSSLCIGAYGEDPIWYQNFEGAYSCCFVCPSECQFQDDNLNTLWGLELYLCIFITNGEIRVSLDFDRDDIYGSRVIPLENAKNSQIWGCQMVTWIPFQDLSYTFA